MKLESAPRFGRRADENGINIFSETADERNGQEFLVPGYNPTKMPTDWTLNAEDLPESIRQFLNSMFAPVALSTASIEWIQDDNGGFYQIDIATGQGEITLFFSKEGELIEYGMQILKSDLPSPVKKSLTRLAPKKVQNSMVVEMRIFEVDYLDKDGMEKTVQFDPRGMVLGGDEMPDVAEVRNQGKIKKRASEKKKS